MLKIGIIGSGFISKGFLALSYQKNDIIVKKILSRSVIEKRKDIPQNLLTNDIYDLIEHSDIIVECSGDTIHAVNCFNVILHQKPIITLNSEFHITCGNYFYKKCHIFESKGDQSGCLFHLNQEIENMGFTPLVYGNYKRYLKYDVGLKQAKYWSKKNKISLDKTIAFTDGSKVEIENVLVANCLNAKFYDKPILGDKAEFLCKKAVKNKTKYVDMFLDKNACPGIFIGAKHDKKQKEYLKYLGFKNKYHIIERPYHFCHLEIYNSIKDLMKVMAGEDQMKNVYQNYMVASLSKKPLKKGESVKKGLGGLEFRGIHHKYNKNLVPITLLENMLIKSDLPPNHLLTFDDVEYDDNLATKIWRSDDKKN